jgi:YspA, cpYpsA-related SLOG family
MKEFKLIVAGGRDFNDAEHLSRVLFAMADVEFIGREISIVSGMARGADALGHRFAKNNNIKFYVFPAYWNRYGKRAGFMRNTDMGNFADGLLAFWDGKSKGTDHMINYMKKLNKPVTVIQY